MKKVKMKKKMLMFVRTMFIKTALIVTVVLTLSGINIRNVWGKTSESIQVEIVSPKVIEAAPIYEGNVEIVVTNKSDMEQNALNCFLSVVDEERKQSFPMDEFGADSYQSRTIDALKPGESVTISIPLRVMYVGNFQLIANVVDYSTNQVYAAASLPINMYSNTNLHKGLVIGVSAVMPVILAVMAFWLGRKRGRRKE